MNIVSLTLCLLHILYMESFRQLRVACNL